MVQCSSSHVARAYPRRGRWLGVPQLPIVPCHLAAMDILQGDDWQTNLDGLFRFAQPWVGDDWQQATCFVLQHFGEAIRCDNEVLVRVHILRHASGLKVELAPPSGQVLLRARSEDWEIVSKGEGPFRALWTQVALGSSGPILDATVGPAFLATQVRIGGPEQISVAELFCGGFCGWTQAAYSLNTMGPKLYTSWKLDCDSALRPFIQTVSPKAYFVNGPEDFSAAPQDSTLVVFAKLQDSWWHRVWAQRPPHLVCLSPPCQPWSTAGRSGGLQTVNGRLLPLAAKILSAVEVPLLCLEEVQGFLHHRDYPLVMRAFQAGDYRVIWQQQLQLSEVMPTHRARLLMILAHASILPHADYTLACHPWVKAPHPTLAVLQAYFPILPADLRLQCRLSPEALDMS